MTPKQLYVAYGIYFLMSLLAAILYYRIGSEIYSCARAAFPNMLTPGHYLLARDIGELGLLLPFGVLLASCICLRMPSADSTTGLFFIGLVVSIFFLLASVIFATSLLMSIWCR